MTGNNFNSSRNSNNNNEKYEKKTFEGIKNNKNFSKFSNKDDNNRSFYENRNNNMNRSISPITHKRNDHIESHKLIESRLERNGNNDSANISYFEEFNVRINFLY